ncbi:TPA: sugar kinase [Pasteurella multocida]|nr:sugar kinase [Pasteurella multocida]
MKKLAIIGECMVELSGEPFGMMFQSYGGDTLNTATYLARISRREDLDIVYITVLGRDHLSDQMLTFWQKDGINTDFVLRDPERLVGLYLIQLDTKGERTFLNWRGESAARYLLQHQEYKRILAYLTQCDMIYLSGISLAILPKEDRESLLTQLQLLAIKGVKIVFDSNYRQSLWCSTLEAQHCYEQLLPYLHLIIVTAEDEYALWRDRHLVDIKRRLQPFRIPHVVIKVGKDGAHYVSSDGHHIHIPAQPIEKVIDTTSAGDAFNAGFLAGYLKGKSIQQCCQQGNLLAGIVIQHKGAIISSEATQHFIKQF